jgi:hypothetical protein
VYDADLLDGQEGSYYATQAGLDTHTATADAHHTRYADTEAVSAVNAETSLTVDVSGDADTLDGAHKSDLDSQYVDASGDTMSGDLDFSGNFINGVEKTKFSNSTNDFWRIEDGSGGSNTEAHTARFDTRDLRYYAGTGGVGTVWQLNLDGSVEYPVGPVTINGETSATQEWASGNNIFHSELSDAPSDSHHTRYADSEAISAINTDADHGSTAAHNYFSGSHADLTNIGASDHHTRYADTEAVSAVNSETSLTVDISGDAETVDGYDIQKDGTDGPGIINFKTV